MAASMFNRWSKLFSSLKREVRDSPAFMPLCESFSCRRGEVGGFELFGFHQPDQCSVTLQCAGGLAEMGVFPVDFSSAGNQRWLGLAGRATAAN